MKKILFILLSLAGMSAMTLSAKSKTVLSLKNGSTVYGELVEMVVGEHVTMLLSDGSQWVYDMDEVLKIEDLAKSGLQIGKACDSGVKKGYRGFVEADYTLGVGKTKEDKVGFSTTHGYQFNPHFFLGGGLGANYYFQDSSNGTFVMFADFRYDLFDRKFTPFFDFKGGYAIGDVEGAYLSPTIGCRMGLGKNFAMNFGLGYTLQRSFETTVDEYYPIYGSMHGFTTRISFEF